MRRVPLLLLALTACVGKLSGDPSDTDTDDPGLAHTDPGDTDPGADTDDGTLVERFDAALNDEVDVLWVVDDSCSMIEEQAALAEGFASFLAPLRAAGLDWHVGVVTTDTENPDQNGKLVEAGGYTWVDGATPRAEEVFAEMASVGTGGSSTERGLLAASRALVPPTQEIALHNQGFSRDLAALHVVIVSDEQDQSAPEVGRDEFVTLLGGLKDEPTTPVDLSAVVGPLPSGCHGAGGDAVPGSIYTEVAEASLGRVYAICDEDWSGLLADLGQAAAGGRHTVVLASDPRPRSVGVVVTTTAGTVRGANTDAEQTCGDATCFAFDVQGRTVRFLDGWVPPHDATIDVTYRPAQP